MSEFEILTYRQIAERLGISPESARKKVRRRKWRVIPGNRPSDPVRVQVPTEILAAARPRREAGNGADPAAASAADRQLLSTLQALEAYVGRVSGQQERLLAELGRLLSELAARDAAHAAALERVRAEERERYRDELTALGTAYEEARTERVAAINRLIADIERERAGRAVDNERNRAELDRQWQTFLEERERHFDSLERERIATAKAEARAYRSDAAAKEMRSALVTVVPRLETLLRPPPSDAAPEPTAAPDDAAATRRRWWPWRRR